MCSGSFNQRLDLEKLSSSVGCIEYDGSLYPAAYIRPGRGIATVYSTGRYVLQGVRSLAEADALYSEIVELLSPFCDVERFGRPTVRNMVCTSDAGHTLDLDSLFLHVSMAGRDASFEPEVFPGLILRTGECTYNIFGTGRFVMLGCRDESEAVRCESRLLSMLSDTVCDASSDSVRWMAQYLRIRDACRRSLGRNDRTPHRRA